MATENDSSNAGTQSEGHALVPSEVRWRNRYTWLKEQGYILRKRYEPDWVPSWEDNKKKDAFYCEDAQLSLHPSTLDATRTSDGKIVCLKCIRESRHPYEVEISSLLTSKELQDQSLNHCVPIYEILKPPKEPDLAILVMPLLRKFQSPAFDTFGEVVSFMKQIFEGLKFMHEHGVAHRDIKHNNLLMDASCMYPEGWHPIKIDKPYNFKGRAKPRCTRTQCKSPPKYYIIDFGIAVRFDPDESFPKVIPIRSGDRTAPELQGEGVYQEQNPFPTDVYYIGNLLRIQFLSGDESFYSQPAFQWVEPLVRDMTQDDPSKRPTMAEVVTRFDELVKSLGSWKLRSMVIPSRINPLTFPFDWIAHWGRRIVFIITRTPAIPLPQ